MNENRKLTIWSGFAALLALLGFIACFLPAYAEPETNFTLSSVQLAFGNERSGANALLIFALVLLIVALLASLASFLSHLLHKFESDRLIMALGIAGGASALFGGMILLTGFLVVDPYNEGGAELFARLSNYFIIMNQKKVTLGVGEFLPFLFAFLAFAASFPGALIQAHHADVRDAEKKAQ